MQVKKFEILAARTSYFIELNTIIIDRIKINKYIFLRYSEDTIIARMLLLIN
jgi:hypothetical protein